MSIISFYRQLPYLKQEAVRTHAVLAGKCLLLFMLPASIAYFPKKVANSRILEIQSDLELYAFHGDPTISPAVDIGSWNRNSSYFYDGPFRSSHVVAPLHPLPEELALFLNLRKNRYHWVCKNTEYNEYAESLSLAHLQAAPDIKRLTKTENGEVYTSVYDVCKEQLSRDSPSDEAKILFELSKTQINLRNEIESKQRPELSGSTDEEELSYDSPAYKIQPRFYRLYIEEFYYNPARSYVALHQLGRANRLVKRAISLCSYIDWPPSSENTHLNFINKLYFLSVLTEAPVKLVGREEELIRYLNVVETGGLDATEIPKMATWHPQLALYMEGLLKFKQMDFMAAMERFSDCWKGVGDREATFLDDMCCLMMTRCCYWYAYFVDKAPSSYKPVWIKLQAVPEPAPKWIKDPKGFIKEMTIVPKNHFAAECKTYLTSFEEERE